MPKTYNVKWYYWHAGHFKQQYCPICKVYQIFKKDNNIYRCMKCRKYTLTIQKD